jgi:hypothetical protein
MVRNGRTCEMSEDYKGHNATSNDRRNITISIHDTTTNTNRTNEGDNNSYCGHVILKVST